MRKIGQNPLHVVVEQGLRKGVLIFETFLPKDRRFSLIKDKEIELPWISTERVEGPAALHCGFSSTGKTDDGERGRFVSRVASLSLCFIFPVDFSS